MSWKKVTVILSIASAIICLAVAGACRVSQTSPPQTAEANAQGTAPSNEGVVRMADGSCVQVLPGWRVVEAGNVVRLDRGEIGQMTIRRVYQAQTAITQIARELERGGEVEEGIMYFEADPSAVTYRAEKDGQSIQVNVYLLDSHHLLYLTTPASSNNQNFAVTEAMRTAHLFGHCR